MKKTRLALCLGIVSTLLYECAQPFNDPCESAPSDLCPDLKTVSLDPATLSRSQAIFQLDGTPMMVHLDRYVGLKETVSIFIKQALSPDGMQVSMKLILAVNQNLQDFLVFVTPDQAKALQKGTAKIVVHVDDPNGHSSEAVTEIRIQ